LLFSFANRIFHQEGLELKGTHQLLVCAAAAADDDDNNNNNILSRNINNTRKNTEAPLEASKQIGLEVNAEKTKYNVMSCH
jgi:hypothetical protein